MAEQVSRRSFFKLLGGAVALAAAPSTVIAKAIEIPVEFGWTWHVDKTKLAPGFADLVKKTLADNASAIRDNLAQNNALFLKLKSGDKVKLNIERISPDEQTKRMAERLKDRHRPPLEKFPETFGSLNNLKNREDFYKGYPAFTTFRRLSDV